MESGQRAGIFWTRESVAAATAKFKNRSSNEIPNSKLERAPHLKAPTAINHGFDFRTSSFIRASIFELRILLLPLLLPLPLLAGSRRPASGPKANNAGTQ